MNKLRGTCHYCKDWEGDLEKLIPHQMSCEAYFQFLNLELADVVEQQIKVLEIDINPHLRAHHEEINQKYVQDWFWLHSDTRNWKWWWWASNPWWGNKSCKTCNDLWHKHEKQIDLLEHKRISIINLVNEKFAEFMMKDLFAEH